MYRSGHLRVLVFTAATISLGMLPAHARSSLSKHTDSPVSQFAQDAQQDARADGVTTVHLRWGARVGVTRYRLQLATDRRFNDIVFDRVIAGTEYQINDLAPGTYYWRIAALTAKLGEFSAPAPIEVTRQTGNDDTQTELPKSSSDKRSDNVSAPVLGAVIAGGGWRTAIGEVSNPVLAHLRSAAAFDVVAVNTAGVTFALDAASGVALWNTRRTPAGRGMQADPTQPAVFLTKARSGLDDVVVLSGINVTRIEGATGRELWRATLPSFASAAAVLSEPRSSEIFVVDNSLQKLFILDGTTGNIVVQTKLPHRMVATPVVFNDGSVGRVMFALENGEVEVRDRTGALIRSGDAVSPATTPPLFVNGPRGGLILVGTRSGLTALSVDDLRPLGRMSISGDAPRGTLAAEDLDGDGVAEVIMITERGRIMAVRAADGKTLWESTGGNDVETTAFADVNGDGVRDVLVAGAQTFAFALSGRDGAILWKDNEGPSSAANHAVSSSTRRVIALPSGSGVLIIGGDSSRTGLRAIEFSKARR
jgi:outer membrane protein assembly factor BamB